MERKNQITDLQISINPIKNLFQLIPEKLNKMEIEKNITGLIDCLSLLCFVKAKAVLVFLVLLFRDQVTSVGIESICSNPVCFDIECVMFGDRSLPKHNDRNSMSNTGTKNFFYRRYLRYLFISFSSKCRS